MKAVTSIDDDVIATASPVELLYRGYRPACAASFAASLFTVAALWHQVALPVLLGWVSAAWLVLAWRASVARRFFSAPRARQHDRRWADRFALGALLSGALWGATAFLFVPSPDVPSLLFASILISGVSAAAAVLHAPLPRISALFLAVALLPFCLRLALFGDRSSLFLAASMGIYLAVLLVASTHLHRFILGSRAVNERSRREAAERERRGRLRTRLFERLLGQAPLEELLKLLAEFVEAAAPRLMCSILLLDADGQRLRVGAAPRLPPTYRAAIDGIEIAEGIGSCGTAAWRGEPVLAGDLRTHPCWKDYRAPAESAGLQSCWSLPILDASGKVLGTFAAYTAQPGLPDETEMALLREASHLAAVAIEHRRADERLQEREREFRSLVEHSPDSIARYDEHCRRTYANPQFIGMAGVSESELLGRTPTEFPGGPSAEQYQQCIREVLASGRTSEFRLQWHGADGGERTTLVRLEPEHDRHGAVFRVLAVGRDVSRLVEYEQKLRQLAYCDGLTGLANREQLKARADEVFLAAARSGAGVDVLILGLDRFKAINDTFGRQVGDALLLAAGERLRGAPAQADLVARLEGDEFGLLFPSVSGEEPETLAAGILTLFREPFHVEGMEVRLTASLGIARFPEHGTEVEEVLRCAAVALHQAKVEGRNRARLYAPELTAAAQERLALEADLRRSLVEGDFELHYQPKIDLRTGGVVGAEALLRWRHPQRGLMTPDRFIGLTEEAGLITELGEWVLRTACCAVCEWNALASEPYKVAVNLSARQFSDGRLGETLRLILAETRCQPQWLELEITESLLLDDRPEILAALESFDALGVTLAIDDFGTGYSALGYLTRFPIHTLKIDRSFIQGVVNNPDSASLVKAIASLARSLRLTLVAEGVEALDQAEFLQEIGCQFAQGFLYGRPMPAARFADLLGAATPALRLPEDRT